MLAYPDLVKLIYPELLRAFRSHLINDIEMVDVPTVAQICRDPDDDKVIATAIFGMVDYLVTEDEDLRTSAVVDVLNEAGITVTSMNKLIKLLDELST